MLGVRLHHGDGGEKEEGWACLGVGEGSVHQSLQKHTAPGKTSTWDMILMLFRASLERPCATASPIRLPVLLCRKSSAPPPDREGSRTTTDSGVVRSGPTVLVAVACSWSDTNTTSCTANPALALPAGRKKGLCSQQGGGNRQREQFGADTRAMAPAAPAHATSRHTMPCHAMQGSE